MCKCLRTVLASEKHSHHKKIKCQRKTYCIPKKSCQPRYCRFLDTGAHACQREHSLSISTAENMRLETQACSLQITMHACFSRGSNKQNMFFSRQLRFDTTTIQLFSSKSVYLHVDATLIYSRAIRCLSCAPGVVHRHASAHLNRKTQTETQPQHNQHTTKQHNKTKITGTPPKHEQDTTET